jgi:hypothetical protein
MVRYQDTLWCDGCGIEITWEPVEKGYLFFCCLSCLDGEKCHCGEEDEEYQSSAKTINAYHESALQ